MPSRFEALVLPGKFLVGKIAELKKHQQEQSRRKVTERELAHLHHKIDKLLTRLEENEPEPAMSQDEECAICISAKATMQTFPCGHRVVCRKCFVKTIQMAVSQRLLPLRCVICRAKILRLKQVSSGGNHHGHRASHHHYSSAETMPASLTSTFRDTHVIGNPKLAKMTKTACLQQQEVTPERHQRHHLSKKLTLPPPTSCNSSRNHFHRSNRRGFRTKSTFLLPIPELEELKIMDTVQQPNFCQDFGKAVWSMQEDLKSKPIVEIQNPDLLKWWSRIQKFRPPSILKVINKWRQH